MFQGERKHISNTPDSLIKCSMQWHLEKTGIDISVLPQNMAAIVFADATIMMSISYSLQSIINEQPDPAKPNSNGSKAGCPRVAPWWAHLTETKLMNCSSLHHRTTKHTQLKTLLRFRQASRGLILVSFCCVSVCF